MRDLVVLAGVLVQDVGVHADCAPLIFLLLVIFCFLGVTSVSAAGLSSLSAMSASGGAPFPHQAGKGRVARTMLLSVTSVLSCATSVVFVEGGGGGAVPELLARSVSSPGSKEGSLDGGCFSLMGFLPCAMMMLRSLDDSFGGGFAGVLRGIPCKVLSDGL